MHYLLIISYSSCFCEMHKLSRKYLVLLTVIFAHLNIYKLHFKTCVSTLWQTEKL